jgi:RimJ/RimL family protein N-acetyltransferase
MKIKTARLHIRALSGKDAKAYFELSQNEGFRKYQISDYRRRSIEESEQWIRALAEYHHRNGFGILGVFTKQDELLIGIGALKYLGSEKASPVELMYRLSDLFWGNGFGLEIGSALVDYAFRTVGLSLIVATVDPANLPSKKILLKLGFKFKELISIEGFREEVYELTDQTTLLK